MNFDPPRDDAPYMAVDFGDDNELHALMRSDENERMMTRPDGVMHDADASAGLGIDVFDDRADDEARSDRAYEWECAMTQSQQSQVHTHESDIVSVDDPEPGDNPFSGLSPLQVSALREHRQRCLHGALRAAEFMSSAPPMRLARARRMISEAALVSEWLTCRNTRGAPLEAFVMAKPLDLNARFVALFYMEPEASEDGSERLDLLSASAAKRVETMLQRLSDDGAVDIGIVCALDLYIALQVCEREIADEELRSCESIEDSFPSQRTVLQRLRSLHSTLRAEINRRVFNFKGLRVVTCACTCPYANK